jgi:hypothetical protein
MQSKYREHLSLLAFGFALPVLPVLVAWSSEATAAPRSRCPSAMVVLVRVQERIFSQDITCIMLMMRNVIV